MIVVRAILRATGAVLTSCAQFDGLLNFFPIGPSSNYSQYLRVLTHTQPRCGRKLSRKHFLVLLVGFNKGRITKKRWTCAPYSNPRFFALGYHRT